MRLFIVIIFLNFPIISFGQYEPGFLPEFFFGRQPSARAETMGKGYVSIDGDLATTHFNPAGLGTIKQLEINTSYTPPGYYLIKGYYTFYGAGYRANKYLQVALSRFHFDFGKTLVANANKTPYTETNTLTISSEPINNLFVGLNSNYFVWQPGIDKVSTSIYFDFGVIKKFPLFKKQHILNLGASISNFNYANTNATFSGINTKYILPVISRYGISYEFSHGNSFFIDSVKTFKLLLQSEYQKLLNSKYRSGIRLGGEIMLFDLLSFRLGYYSEKVYAYSSLSNSKLKSFTYGLGIQLPLYKFTKIPSTVNFDYTSLPQPSYVKNQEWDNFTTYSLRLNILLKNKVVSTKSH